MLVRCFSLDICEKSNIIIELINRIRCLGTDKGSRFVAFYISHGDWNGCSFDRALHIHSCPSVNLTIAGHNRPGLSDSYGGIKNVFKPLLLLVSGSAEAPIL